MWLLTTAIAAVLVTILAAHLRWRHRLAFLALMLWGATVMIAVDRVLGYNGGVFMENQTDGLIQNSALLGIVMLVPVVAIWLAALIAMRRREPTTE